MSRLARVVVAGVPHHVTQRGNDRNPIFLSDTDRIRYLTILHQESRKYGLRILGYCLMTNHVHLVVVPESADSLSKALGRTSYGYTRTFHAKYGGCGHLWQDRSWSCPMDASYSIAALVYTELNPVRARMVQDPADCLWSSARAHLSGRDRTGLLDMDWWRHSRLGSDWAARLSAGIDERVTSRLRSAVAAGLPCGAEEFVKEIERRTGRRFDGDSHE
jgi:putative transposase